MIDKAIETVEMILDCEFIEYRKVYEMAKQEGVRKVDVKKAKVVLGVKTLQIENEGDKLWLWYIPKNIWSKHCVER